MMATMRILILILIALVSRPVAAAPTVYTYTPNNTVVLSTVAATLVSRSLTVAAGDSIYIDVYWWIQNNSAANRNYTFTCGFGSLLSTTLQGTVSAGSSTTVRMIRTLCIVSVPTTSQARIRHWLMLTGLSTINSLVGSVQNSASNPYENVNQSVGDETGAQTLVLSAVSSADTITQTARIHTYTITHYTSSP